MASAEERVMHAEARLAAASDDRWAIAYESVLEAREQLGQYAAMQARFDQWVADHRDELNEYRQLDRQVTTALRERIVDVETDPPAHLIDAIGYPPAGVDARQEWRDAAVELERQQVRQHLNDDVEPQLAGSEVLELQ